MTHALAPSAGQPALTEHPLRGVLSAEIHARPFETFKPPVRASHLALTTGETGAGADRAHLLALCARFGVEPPAEGAIHFSRDFGAFRLRWERHTEFSTYTVYRFDAFPDPFAETALGLVPADWLAEVPGELLAAAHVALDDVERGPDELARLFEGNMQAGSRMLGGAAQAWTDHVIHGDGFGRILVRDCGMTAGQCGRLVQRLLDIDTYRMMALLALPVARSVGPKVAQVEAGLTAIVSRMAGAGGDDRGLLDDLSALSAEAEAAQAQASFRFAAARAYHDLVQKRIDELREDRIPGTQTIAEFLERRLGPAMKTCEATRERQEGLSRRLTRASALLRTRVDIALEEKNRDLLKSMNRRAEMQLRLQETVEGLSVVAISYYVLGLLGYAAKGAKAGGLPVNPDVAVLLGLPVVLGLVWLGVRRLRKALGNGHGED